MPLVGIVDPSHKESRRKEKPGRLPNWYSVEEVLDRVEESLKWAPWTWEIIDAVLAETQESGDLIRSSSLVAACPRADVIKRKADYVTDLKNLYIPFRGTMVHRTLERHVHRGLAVAEARFYTTIDGIPVTCSPDYLSATTLLDYKVTDTPPAYNYPYTHHKEQVEFNAFVARHAEKWDLPESIDTIPFDPRENPVKHVGVVYLGPKFVKVLEIEKTEEVFTRTGKFKKATVPFVWNDKLTLAVFRPRIHMLRNALESFPEWPDSWTDFDNINKKTGEPKVWTAEEVWGGEPGWQCPGPPLCALPDCLARRWPHRMTWDPKGEEYDGDEEA